MFRWRVLSRLYGESRILKSALRRLRPLSLSRRRVFFCPDDSSSKCGSCPCGCRKRRRPRTYLQMDGHEHRRVVSSSTRHDRRPVARRDPASGITPPRERRHTGVALRAQISIDASRGERRKVGRRRRRHTRNEDRTRVDNCERNRDDHGQNRDDNRRRRTAGVADQSPPRHHGRSRAVAHRTARGHGACATTTQAVT